jgi:hypothetical protein
MVRVQELRGPSGIQVIAGWEEPRTSKPSEGGAAGAGRDGGEAMSRRGRTGTAMAATRVRPGGGCWATAVVDRRGDSLFGRTVRSGRSGEEEEREGHGG